MFDTILTITPWIITLPALLLAVVVWLDARDARARLRLSRMAEASALNERDKLLKQVAEQQAAIDAACASLHKASPNCSCKTWNV